MVLFMVTTALAILAERFVSTWLAVGVVLAGGSWLLWIERGALSHGRDWLILVRRRRPVMSLVIVITIGACIGGALFGLVWKYALRPAKAIAEESTSISAPPQTVPDHQMVSDGGSHASDEPRVGTFKVVDENDVPVRGAEILLIRQNGTHSMRVATDDLGIAEVQIMNEHVSIFCALDGFSGYYQADYNPFSPLKIRMKKRLDGGSVIFTDGTGYITGLSGRLNPILDTLGRTYLYASNIAINGGQTQPVDFVPNRPLMLEDASGHKVEIEIEIVAIIASSSLIRYRRL